MKRMILSLAAPLALWIASTAGADEPLHVRVDEFIAQGAKGHAVAPVADDAEFLRRAYLDFAGRIPSADEARKFLADESEQKRVALIDELLALPEYSRRMQELFHVLLMERRGDHDGWRDYLRESFAENKPWDQLVREMLTPQTGEDADHGSDFFLAKRLYAYGANSIDHEGLTRDVGRMFLGIDLQCAQCHDHLFIYDYEQVDFQGLLAAYKNLKIRGKEFPAMDEKPMAEKLEFISVFESEAKQTGPRVPGGKEIEAPEKPGPDYSAVALVGAELPSADNELFTLNIANRLWFIMMGRGLVHPIDLHHSDNPASHPELLELLAKEFVAHEFDIRWMLRELALTQTYQRSSRLPEGEEIGTPEMFTVAIQKRLSAEQLMWSTLQATGALDRVTQSQGTMVEKPDEKLEALQKSFVEAFSNPPREPETEYAASVQGALFLLNDEQVVGLFEPQKGNLMSRVAALSDPAQIAEELYLSILTRPPSAEEQADVAAYLEENSEQREAALGRLGWALLASLEFSVNH